jgi:hypothetical protein
VLAVLSHALLFFLIWQRQLHWQRSAEEMSKGPSAVSSNATTGADLNPPPPQLRPRRIASADAPLLAHEELLTLEGDGEADISALADLTRTYLEQPFTNERDSLGFNDDLARVLTDREVLGEAAIPAGHPALRDGQLIDRWGTPWFVHPLSSDLIQLRSAGPDCRLFTGDDLVSR